MLTFNEFVFLENVLNQSNIHCDLVSSFFDILESESESETWNEFLTEKARSTHSGIQPWNDTKITKDMAKQYQNGDTVMIQKINAMLDKSKQETVETIRPRFTQILHKVASVVPNSKILVDIKSNRSIVSKIMRKTEYGKMKDILRSAIIVQNQSDIPKIMKAMKKEFQIFELKTKEKEKDPFGYYGSYHYIVEFGGVLVEVQLMTKRLWTYKELGHKVYDKWREQISKNPNLLNQPDSKELKKDIALSKRIFSRGNGANVRI